MSDNGDYVERVTTTEGPTTTIRREEVVRTRGSSIGWWVAALIALVAIVGVFLVVNSNNTSEADLQAARDQGMAEAALANASVDAQAAAAQASAAAQSAMDSTSRAAEQAAVGAQAAAERSAQAAQRTAEAAQDSAAAATPTTPE